MLLRLRVDSGKCRKYELIRKKRLSHVSQLSNWFEGPTPYGQIEVKRRSQNWSRSLINVPHHDWRLLHPKLWIRFVYTDRFENTFAIAADLIFVQMSVYVERQSSPATGFLTSTLSSTIYVVVTTNH